MSTDIVVQDDALTPVTLFGTDNPAEVVERAANVARTLEQLVRKQKLIVSIGQSEHVRVEGWTLLGSMLGVFPVVEWTRPLGEDGQAGWEARVEARTRNGEVVGAAEAECLRSEKTWRGRDDYALRSMAQTRAVSKALRLPLGFVMQLAGFDPTPAEEMPVVEGRTATHAVRSIPPDPLRLTDAQAKKLNVLVGTLREAGHITTEQLFTATGREHITGDDGQLHWGDLRATLSKGEAHELIERLARLEENVKPKFQVPAGATVQEEL